MNQVVESIGVQTELADPGAQPQRQPLAVDVESARTQALTHPRHDPLRADAVRLGQQQHELVSTPTHGEIGGAGGALDHLPEMVERVVAHDVPESLVELLEVVEIEDGE